MTPQAIREGFQKLRDGAEMAAWPMPRVPAAKAIG